MNYYDALMQSIRDGIEDPDLMSEEDLKTAFTADEDEQEAEA